MCKCVSYRYLIPVTGRQPEGNADGLYAFKSRGFGGEIGVMAPALTAEISCAYHNMVFPG